MSSFVNKKTRLFKEAGDNGVIRKRSEGRLKTYISATDVRAWCGNVEDRRQYILELIQKDIKSPRCGKIIPIEAIIDILLSEKDAQIELLQDENKLLKKLCGDKQITKPDQIELKPKLESKPQLTSKPKLESKPQLESKPKLESQPQLESKPKLEIKPTSDLTLTRTTSERTVQTHIDNELTVKAIKELENIEKIVDTSLENENCDEIQKRLAQLDQIIDERDELKLRVRDLEQQLGISRNQPDAIENIQQQQQHNVANELNLQQRFNNLSDLSEKVRMLKRQADQCKYLKKTTNDKDAELRKMYCHCKQSEINVESLKNKIKQLESENCKLQNDNKEKNCEIAKIKQNLDGKLKDLDIIQNERDKLKKQLRELQDIAEDCEELRNKAKYVEDLEKERDLLLRKIEDCECCIEQQDNENKSLLSQIDCLTQDLDTRQDEMKTKIVKMRIDLNKKDELIQKSEEQLANVQNQLRQSIDGLSCETTCLRKRIEELDIERIKYHTKAKTRKDELNKIKREIEEKNKLLKKYKQENDELEQELIQLQEIIDRNNRRNNDEYIKRILGQTNCALECLIEKMRHYGLGDGTEKLLSNDEIDEKIITSQQELLDAHKKIEELENNLRMCKEENETLKNTNAEIKQLHENELQQTRQASENLILEKDNEINNLKSNDDNNRIAELQAQLASCQEENKKLQNNNELSKDEINKLKQLNDKLEQQIIEYKDKRQPNDEEFDNMKQLIADLRQQLADCQNNVKSDKTNDELDKMKTLINDLQKQLDDCHKSQQSTDEIDKMKRIISDLEQKLNDCENMTKSSSLPTNNEILKLTNLIQDLQKQLTESHNLAKSTDNEIKNLKKTVDDLHKKLDDCQNTSSKSNLVNDEINNLRKMITNLEQQLNDCQNKSKLSNTENEKLNNLIDDLQKQLNDCRNSNKSDQMNDEMTNMKDLIDDLKQQLTDCQNKLLNNDNKKTNDIIDDLQKQLNDCRNSNKSSPINEEMDNMKHLITDLEQQLANCRKNAEKSNDSDGDLAAENLQLNNRIKELLEEIDRLNQLQGEDKRVKELEDMLEKQKKECENTVKKLKADYERNIERLNTEKKDNIGKAEEIQPESTPAETQPIQQEDKAEEQTIQPKKQEKPPKKRENKPAIAKKPPKIVETKSAEQEEIQAKPDENLPKKVENPPKKRKTKSEIARKPKVQKKKPEEEKVTDEKKDECKCGQLPIIIPISLPPSDIKIQFCKITPKISTTPCRPTCLANYNFNREIQLPKCTPCNMNRIEYRPVREKPKTLEIVPLTRQYPSLPSCTVKISGYSGVKQMPQICQARGPLDTELIQKIIETENRLLLKQQRAKAKVDELQNILCICKTELKFEKQKNDELINRYATQSKTVANMWVKMNSVKQEIIEEKMKNRELDSILKNLEKDLQKEKQRNRQKNSTFTPRNLSENQKRYQGIPSFRTEIQLRSLSARSCNCSARKSNPPTFNRYEIDD